MKTTAVIGFVIGNLAISHRHRSATVEDPPTDSSNVLPDAHLLERQCAAPVGDAAAIDRLAMSNKHSCNDDSDSWPVDAEDAGRPGAAHRRAVRARAAHR